MTDQQPEINKLKLENAELKIQLIQLQMTMLQQAAGPVVQERDAMKAALTPKDPPADPGVSKSRRPTK